MKRLIHLSLVAMLLAASCTRYSENDTLIPQHQSVKFEAHITDAPTRIYADQQYQLHWHEGDLISIFYASTFNNKYKFDGATGDRCGTFSEVENKFHTGNPLTRNYALYPYRDGNKIDDRSDAEGYGSFTTSMPAVQYYAEDSFGKEANTMVAVTTSAEERALYFKNVCGYLVVQIYGNFRAIQSIVLQGNSGEKLSGEATITATLDQAPTIEMSNSANSSVELLCNEGVSIGKSAEQATQFWFAIPPTTFEDGIRITITDTENNKYEKATSKRITVKRNTVHPLAAFDIINESDRITPSDANYATFLKATRTPLNLKNAEGFVIKEKIFGVPQNISVIKFAQSGFKIKPLMGETVRTVSTYGKESGADYVVNACYWSVSTGSATSLIKSDGVFLSTSTWSSYYPRVNGLLYMHDNYIDILQSYDYPDYPGLVDDCDNIIACGPVLIDEGRRLDYTHITDSEDETMQSAASFYTTRHPRTVFGCDAQGNIYMMVVDGRATDNAAGASIEELTDICCWLGMIEAMNLDGGGSSTLWSKELGVINYPCDNKKFDHEGEREVKSAIVALPR